MKPRQELAGFPHRRLIGCLVATMMVSLFSCSTSFATDAKKSNLQITTTVVDVSGIPIAGASVKLSASPDFTETATTNEKGRVEFANLVPGRIYRASASHGKYNHRRGTPNHRLDTGSIELPPIILPGFRSVTGTVVSADGKPIPGVRVFQRGDAKIPTEATSDDDGLFQLEFPETPGYIFCDANGYWFTGRVISEATGDPKLNIVLTERDQPNPETFDPDWMRLPTEQEVVVAKEFIRSTVQDCVAEINGLAPIESLEESARRTREFHRRRVGWLDREAGRELAVKSESLSFYEHLYDIDEEKPELILAWSNTSDGASGHISGLKHVASTLKTASRGETGQNNSKTTDHLIASTLRLLPELRGIADAQARLSRTCDLVGVLNRCGAAEIAREVAGRCSKELETLEGSAKDHVQWRLCDTYASLGETRRSLELLQGLEPLHTKIVALGIVKHDPEVAWDLVRELEFDPDHGSRISAEHVLPMLCYYSAPADVELAVKFADKMDDSVARGVPFPSADDLAEMDESVRNWFDSGIATETSHARTMLKAKLFGLIAGRVADSHPDRARSLIESAVNSLLPLRKAVKNEQGGWIYPPAMYLASIVPDAARVDAGLGAEVSWRAMSIRMPVLQDPGSLVMVQSSVLEMHEQLAPNGYHVAEKYLQSAIAASFAGTATMSIATSGVPIARQVELANQACDRAAGPGLNSPRNVIRCGIAIGLRSAVTKGELGSSVQDQVSQIHNMLWFPHFED